MGTNTNTNTNTTLLTLRISAMGTGAALPLGRQLEQDFQENIFLLLSFILHHIHICFGNMKFFVELSKRL